MTGPLPYTQKPSIVDRVLGRLFPTAQYAGLFDPQQQQDLQRQGLLQLGTGILAQQGPGNAVGALGRSYQALNFPQMAEQALQLRALQEHAARQKQLQDLGTQLTTSGGDPAEIIRQVMPMFLDDPATLKALAEAAKNLGTEPRNLQEVKGITDNRLGSSTIGQRGTALVDPRGRIVQFYQEGQEPTKIGPEVPLAYAKDFENAIAPQVLAKQSYDTYQANRTETGPIADQTRLAAAINVVLPGSHVTPAQLADPATAAQLRGIPVIGPIIAALDVKGELSPDSRRSLDALIENAAQLRRTESADLLIQKRRLAPGGVNASSYLFDPWAPKTPAPSLRRKLKF